jgi:hypothetical protein
LTNAPGQVVLRFDENIRAPGTIVVTGPAGRVSHGPSRILDNTVSVDVTIEPEPADVGLYHVAYRVVSADGHPVANQLSFEYRPPGITASSKGDASDGSPAAATGQSKVVLIGVVALVVLIGVAALGRGLRPGRHPGRRS